MSDESGESRGEEDRDAATAEECQEPEADEGAESFTRDDELQEAFNPGPIARVLGEDGMPVPVIDDQLVDAHAPPFLPEKNQICHELAEEFVVRNPDGEILMRWPRAAVRRTPYGVYYAGVKDGSAEHESLEVGNPEEYDAETWARLLYPMLAENGGNENACEVVVEPLRPACAHLVRQLIPPAASQAHVLKRGWMKRLCSARRSVAGAFLDLGEDEVKACSMRVPFDAASDAELVEFDRELAEKSRNRTHHKMFNVKQDLENEDKPLEAFQEATRVMLEAAKKET